MSHLTWARKRTPKALINEWPEEKITIPNTTPSLRKLLDQHSRGMPLPPDKEGQYFGDLEVPDFDQMDPIEVKEYRDNLRDQIQELRDVEQGGQERAEQLEPPAPPTKGAVFAAQSETLSSEASQSHSDMVKAIREAFKLE